MDDLVKWNGLFYKKYTEVPFTGKRRGHLGTVRDMVRGSVTTKREGYGKKAPTRTESGRGLGLILTKLEQWMRSSQEPMRMG